MQRATVLRSTLIVTSVVSNDGTGCFSVGAGVAAMCLVLHSAWLRNLPTCSDCNQLLAGDWARFVKPGPYESRLYQSDQDVPRLN